mmetsp:Transcript_29712/g.5359  ORF Transcript_29712/g.5359 Transcript_29712/m.5359 type:complete len:83 (+) Transcript_29712:177-425(+)
MNGDSYWWNKGGDYNIQQQVHTVVFTGIRPECQYQYQVGDGTLNWSDSYLFGGKTPDYEAPYNYNGPVKMVIYGDLGTGPIG